MTSAIPGIERLVVSEDTAEGAVTAPLSRVEGVVGSGAPAGAVATETGTAVVMEQSLTSPITARGDTVTAVPQTQREAVVSPGTDKLTLRVSSDGALLFGLHPPTQAGDAVWGGILGSIGNQTDLVQYVQNQIDSGGGAVYVQPLAPLAPEAGSLWLRTTDDSLLVYNEISPNVLNWQPVAFGTAQSQIIDGGNY